MIAEWTAHPETLGLEDARYLQDCMRRAPYCAAYRLLYAAVLANTNSPQLPSEVRRTAVYVPNRSRLLRLVARGQYEWLDLVEQAETRGSQSTDAVDVSDFQLVDRFLEQMHISSASGTTSYTLADIGEIGVNTEIGEDENSVVVDSEADDQMSIIDNFIQAEESGTLFVPPSEPTADTMATGGDRGIERIREKAFLTESLAKIYIKQHKYEQALAIIRRLNLKYPKKNTYFADQIRFLETIIDHQKSK